MEQQSISRGVETSTVDKEVTEKEGEKENEEEKFEEGIMAGEGDKAEGGDESGDESERSGGGASGYSTPTEHIKWKNYGGSGRRGRPVVSESLKKLNLGAYANLSTIWGNVRGSSCEGERMSDDKRKREDEKNELKRASPSGFKKSKITKRTPPRGENEVENRSRIEQLIMDFREVNRKKLEEVERTGRETNKEVREIKDRWIAWEEAWAKEKEQMFEKLDEIEKRNERRDKIVKDEIKGIDERMRKLELR